MAESMHIRAIGTHDHTMQLVGVIYDTWGNGPNHIQVKPAVKPHPGNATTNITITFFQP